MPHVVFQDDLPGLPRGAETVTSLLDLGLPCELACPGCPRRDPAAGPAGVETARRQLRAATQAAAERRVRAVLFGGDPLGAPDAVEALVAEAREACARRGSALDVLLLSSGVRWDDRAAAALARSGTSALQVTLDGPRERHDALHPLRAGGGSFDLVLATLRRARGGAARLVARMNARPDDPEAPRLAAELERAGLFAGPSPVTLLVSPPAPYRSQAVELVRLVG